MRQQVNLKKCVGITKNVLEEHDFRSLEELREHTQVIEVDQETIIYQVF